MSPSSSCAKSEIPTLATSAASTHSWSVVYLKLDGNAAGGREQGRERCQRALENQGGGAGGLRVPVRTGERAEGDGRGRRAEGRRAGHLRNARGVCVSSCLPAKRRALGDAQIKARQHRGHSPLSGSCLRRGALRVKR